MSILGTENSLNSLKRESIVNYFNNNYIPNNIVISLVGNFDKNIVFKEIEKVFSSYNPQNILRENGSNPNFISNYVHKNKDTEQAHICIGYNGIELGSKYTYSYL